MLLPIDRNTKFKKLQNLRRAYVAQKALARRLRKDEDGGIIVLTLLLLISMLIVGGMGVDFMRFESERTKLQSVSDRAVLAAASLDQTMDPADVIADFFETAGYGENIVGTPVVVDNGNSRTVTVNSQVAMDTFYLRLAGTDQLRAPAASAATEGVGKVEISLVLDISGSMRFASSTTSESAGGKFRNMQDAAKAFAAKVLDPVYDGQVSLNIVPYAGGTNPGPEMFAYLNGVRWQSPSIIAALELAALEAAEEEATEEGEETATEEEATEEEEGSFEIVEGIELVDDPYQASSCLELEASDFTSSGLPGTGRQQVAHFQFWSIAASVMDWGWCPQDVSAIKYALSNAADAEAFIDGIRMHDGTGTHYGMKWGLAALDPSTQPAFAALNAIDNNLVPDSFVNRPAAWDDNETRKIIVLMTDGAITEQVRPVDPLHPDNPDVHLQARPGSHRYQLTNAGTNVNRFDDICDLAKSSLRDVDVYTVAFGVGVGSAAETQMRNCASQPSMFFRASGTDITTVFEGIAQQITELRLNL